jgi:hypothetical protein
MKASTPATAVAPDTSLFFVVMTVPFQDERKWLWVRQADGLAGKWMQAGMTAHPDQGKPTVSAWWRGWMPRFMALGSGFKPYAARARFP